MPHNKAKRRKGEKAINKRLEGKHVLPLKDVDEEKRE